MYICISRKKKKKKPPYSITFISENSDETRLKIFMNNFFLGSIEKLNLVEVDNVNKKNQTLFMIFNSKHTHGLHLYQLSNYNMKI